MKSCQADSGRDLASTGRLADLANAIAQLHLIVHFTYSPPNFCLSTKNCRQKISRFNLHDRRLLDDIAVVTWGEFGRTPKINANAGRDHWPSVCSALLAGGGMRHGQLLGASTEWGEQPNVRPVHFREVFATLYERLGMDVAKTLFVDLAGRPQYLVGDHRPLPELL